MRPPVIAIGGMDRAGKTLQRRGVLELLEERGQAPVSRWMRAGYTRHLEAVKRALRRLGGRKPQADPADAEPAGRYPRRAEHFRSGVRRRLWIRLALLDLLWIFAVDARRLRRRGHAVVFDRGLEDARVDFRVNFPGDRVERSLLWRLLERFALRPDATFVLLIPVEESLRRAAASRRRRRELPEALARRREAYEEICARGAAEAIDGCRPPAEISAHLRARVDALLAPASRIGAAPRAAASRGAQASPDVARPLTLLALCLLL
jgi:thymidylate kinase